MWSFVKHEERPNPFGWNWRHCETSLIGSASILQLLASSPHLSYQLLKSQTPQEIRAKNFQWLSLHWHPDLTLSFIIMRKFVVIVILVVKVKENLRYKSKSPLLNKSQPQQTCSADLVICGIVFVSIQIQCFLYEQI